MKLLFLGDIVGRTGREGVLTHLPHLKSLLQPDWIVANAENAAGGFGISEIIAHQLHEAGIDCLTTGNHIWDQRALIGSIDRLPWLLRPLNAPGGTPGRGWFIVQSICGHHLLVANVMARLFMDPFDDPFAVTDQLLNKYRLGKDVSMIVIDFHGEATSEKMAMGHFLDGRVSAVIGTHSHVPTADAQILPGGTGFQCDAGMCGDYDSVIGMKKAQSVYRFVTKLPTKLVPSDNEASVCGVYLETDNITGLASRIHPVRIGGRLHQEIPYVGDAMSDQTAKQE